MADMDQDTTVWIKKEGTDEDLKDALSMPLEDPLNTEQSSLHVKQDIELKQHVDGSKHNFVGNPLGISWPSDFIKEEPELHLEVDEAENIVISSTSYESNSTRFIQSTGGSCGVSLEETVNKGVVFNGLEIPEDSAQFTKLNTGTQRWISEEDSLFDSNLKCSLREKEFHRFSCSSCLQSFSSKYSLIMHVFIHINGVQPPSYVCKSCGEVFPNNIRLNKHFKRIQDDKPKRDNKCDVCGKSFSVLSSLNTHKLIHTGSRPHKCDVCGKSFLQRSNLGRHKLIHTGMKPHSCDACGKSFTDLSKLKRHSVVHTGKRAHTCNDCGKSFTELHSLKKHASVHTGIRPHTCDVCGKSFTRLDCLRVHKLIHSGIRPHKCDVCGKSFTESTTLRRHKLIHTGMKPPKCDVCGKSFTYLGNLKKHILIHTGMRPHTCVVCGKSFTELSTLRRHKLIHTGMKPHKCVVYGKSCTHLCTLKSHTLIHTRKRSTT